VIGNSVLVEHRLLKPRDAAAFLGVHEKTAIKMARDKKLPGLKVGKHWLFRPTDLLEWASWGVQRP
jgi:excisionase family DNA binding protein